MDSRQFDALARALSVSGSRRRALTALLGSGFGWLARTGFGSPDAAAKTCKQKCKKKKTKNQRRKCLKRCKKGPCDVCASGCAFSSVQKAINAAQDGDTITLCAETYGGLIAIDTDLTLIGVGDGEGGTILDGQGNGPVVTVASGSTVVLEGLRITGGDDGGILNVGALTLTGCTVTSNSALVGGGIYNSANATLTLNGCTVTDNVASSSGGGIFNNTNATVTLNDDSSVTENEAGVGGGGIYNYGAVTLNDSSSVTDNEPDDCVNVGGTGCP